MNRIIISINKTKTPVSINSIRLANHKFILEGRNLNTVSDLKIKAENTETTLAIDSQSSNQLIANTINNVTFAAGNIFDLILTSANASTTFTINFSLCDSSLNGKGFNCSITANDKDILSYDANTGKWSPRSINGQIYKGTFNAVGGIIPMSGPYDAGDYYIISAAGIINTVSYVIGDWIAYNGSTWEKVANSTAVLNIFGRTGAIVAVKGDYNLDKLADVDLSRTPPISGDVLKFDGTKWIPGIVSSSGGGGAGTLTSVTGTLPLSVATGTSTPLISIATASSGVAGALSSTAYDIFNNKLGSALTSGNIFIGNASNIATGMILSGDVTINNTGISAIGAAKITNAMLLGSIDLTTKVAGALPIANGGTAAITPSAARANLGLVIGNGIGEIMTFTTSMSCFPYEKLEITAAPYILRCVTDNANTNYALLAGRATGQVLNGGAAASESLTLDSTTHATKGFVLINPTGGNVGIGTLSPTSGLNVVNGSIVSNSVTNTVAYINFGAGNVQVSSTAVTTINICGMKDGGSYTLILTGVATDSNVTINSFPTYINATSCSGTGMQMDLGGGSTTFISAGNVNILSFIYISNLGANGTVYGVPSTNYNYR